MILENVGIVAVALKMGLKEFGHFRQRLVAVAHSMGFQIGFTYHVESVLVAKVVPAGIVGIVARAHGIDVVLFHYLDVLHHTLYAHYVAAVGVHLMTVCTLYQYGLAVDEEL